MPTPPSAHDASSNDVDPIKQFETIVDAISADGNQACSQPQSEQNPEVLFVDKAVEGFKSIVADFVDCRETEVFFINHGSAGLAQIADHLEGRSGIDAIHIISHENDGQLNLGNSAIDQGQLSGQYSSELIRIGQSLTDSGNILIYGCDIESSDTCARFIEEFTSLTDAEVAISTASKPKNTVVEFKTTASSSNSFTRVPLETDAGFVVGTESFANMNEIAITPQSQGGVSTRVYENTATANNGAIVIDLHLTLVDTFDENGDVTTGSAKQLPVTLTDFSGGPILLARNIGSSAGGFEGHTAQFKAEFFNSSSGEPLSMIGDFTFRDIDFIPSCGNSETLTGTGIEAVTAVADEILSYQISSDPVTDIAIEDSNDGTIKFANYETCGGPNDEQRWVSIRFHGKESLNLTFQARNANTGYGLSTSNFSKTPISFSQPNARNDETNTTQNTTHSGPRAVKVNQSGAYGSILIDNDGTYIYTLDRDNPDVKALSPGQTLEETFAYALSGPESKNPSATLTITITYDKLSPIVGGTIPPQSDLNGERINTLNAWAYLPDLPEPEGQSLTFSAANLPSGLSIDSSTGEITGILKINASQDAPEDIFSVEVTATNSNGGLVSTTFDWTITYPTSNVSDPLNDLPIVNTAIPDQAHFNSDTIRVNVSNNFGSAAGKPLTFEATGLPPGLSIEPSGTITGTIDQNASQNGSYIVVITADDHNGRKGTDTFSWRISDPASKTQAVEDDRDDGDDRDNSLSVSPINDRPIVNTNIPDQINCGLDNIDANISPNFSSAGDEALSFTATSLPRGLSIDTAGNITGTIDASQAGPYTVVIVAENANGETVTDTFNWSIKDPESATAGEQANDVGVAIDGDCGTIQINSDGSYTYALDSSSQAIKNLDAGKKIVETFQSNIDDGQGGFAAAELTIKITGTSTTSDIKDSRSTGNQNPITVDPLAEDADSQNDPTLVSLITAAPSNGVVIVNPDGSATYTRNAGFHGEDSFDYQVSQRYGNGDVLLVTVEIAPSTDTTLAVEDADFKVAQDTPLMGSVVDIDSKLDGNQLTYALLTPTTIGDLAFNPDGSFTYVPTENFTGTVSFDYETWDQNGVREAVTTTINVTDLNDAVQANETKQSVSVESVENDPPLAQDDFVTTPFNTTIVLNVIGNDADCQGNPLSVILLNQSPNGTAVVNPDGTLQFTPTPGFEGSTTIHYLIEDPNGSSTDATVTIDVEPQSQSESESESSSNFSKPHFAAQTGERGNPAGSTTTISQKIFSLAPAPVFNGHAKPETQVIGRIYDSSASLIGEASVNTDSKGNWQIQFVNVKGHEFYQVEFETASDPMANANERLGLHMTNKSYQSMSPMTSSNRPLLSQEREKELETLSGTR